MLPIYSRIRNRPTEVDDKARRVRRSRNTGTWENTLWEQSLKCLLHEALFMLTNLAEEIIGLMEFLMGGKTLLIVINETWKIDFSNFFYWIFIYLRKDTNRAKFWKFFWAVALTTVKWFLKSRVSSSIFFRKLIKLLFLMFLLFLERPRQLVLRRRFTSF